MEEASLKYDHDSTCEYSLRLFDREVARFSVVSDDFGESNVANVEIDESSRHLLPLNMIEDPSPSEMKRFILSRQISRDRVYCEKILAPFGVSAVDWRGILDITCGVSFNDSYFMPRVGNDICFEDACIYGNAFDPKMQLAAIAGISSSGKSEQFDSAELTVTGSFPKALRRVDDRLELCKAGSILGGANNGREPFAEEICARLLDACDVAHAEYRLEVWNGRLCTASPLFNNRDVSFVPFSMCVSSRKKQEASIARALDFYGKIGDEAAERFRDMLVFDAIVYNHDRHLSNHGVLRDNATGRVLAMAPVFDDNCALWTREPVESESLEKLVRKAEWGRGAFSLSLGEQAAVLMDDRRALLAESVDEAFQSLELGQFIETWNEQHEGEPVSFSQSRLDALRRLVSLTAQHVIDGAAHR